MKKFLYSLPVLREIYDRFFSERKIRVAAALRRMQAFQKRGNYRAAWRIQKRLELSFGVLISHRARIGRNFCLKHPIGVVVGTGAEIGDNVTVFQNVTIGGKDGKYPKIGNNVTIFANACVIGPVEIGDDTVIGAGSVVTKDIAPAAVAIGNPCQVKRGRDLAPTYDGAVDISPSRRRADAAA